MQCRVSLSVLHLVSWFHQSVVISPDIRSIKLILREQKKQGWLLEILFVQTVCVCLCVHVQLWLCMKHTPVFSRVDLNVPRVPVYVCIYSFFFFFHLFVFLCVHLEMPSVHPGPSAFYVKRQQEQGGSIQVASRADNSYELWTCFVSRHHPHKQKHDCCLWSQVQ